MVFARYRGNSDSSAGGVALDESSINGYPSPFLQRAPGNGSVDEVPLPVVRIRGVELHAITERQCIEHILECIAIGRGGSVVTPNLDIIRRCTRDLNFAALVSEADLVVADGTPLIWASRIAGTPLPERIPGSDLIKSLSAAAAIAGRSVFMLGGLPGAAEGAAKVLQAASPDLKVVGTYCPAMGFEKNLDEIDFISRLLAEAKPDIIWVALGSPKQEHLINRLRDVLPGSWWLGVGISFSFLTGEVRRAPKWIQKLGLEWFHRMAQEPKRLAKRYLVDGVPFCASLMIGAAWQRATGGVDHNATHRGHRYRGRRTRRPDMMSAANLRKLEIPAESSVTAANNSEDGVRVLPTPLIRPATTNGRTLSRLKAVILLGGKVRQTSLGAALERSVLDLPLEQNGTLLNHWIMQCDGLAKRVGLNDLAVRVMVDQKALEPTSINPAFASMVHVERDRSSFRGTGGLLADIAADYADDDLILVANASQVLLDPLAAIAQALDHKTGDFTLISHRDGTASGIMLLSCKTVRGINPVGFIDLKEQALPSIAKNHEVRVVHCRQPTGLPLFSLPDYISALQQFHRRRATTTRRARANPLCEDFARHFAIAEPGAEVADSAYLHDAVVLNGAVVEPGAAVIRSLVLPGAIVKAGAEVSDQIVGL